MPLLALVDGERTISTLLSDEDWTTLQAAVRGKRKALVLACGKPGHLRTSKLGTRHFVHGPGSGDCTDHGKETAQHLLAKSIIVRAALDAGWNAEPELRGNGWIADVLADNGTHRIAFEVQWSAQTGDEFENRQQRYQQDGVRCAWFTRFSSSVPSPRGDLPVFLLAADGDSMTVQIAERTLPLAEAVTLLLSGKIKHRDYLSNGEPGTVPVDYYATDCYKCHYRYLVWEVEPPVYTGACGRRRQEYDFGGYMWGDDKPEAHQAVRAAGPAVAERVGQPLANLSRRYTKTAETTYMAFSCPRCKAVFGDWFLRSFLMNARDEEPTARVDAASPDRGIAESHWCLDAGNGHCRVPPPGWKPREAVEPQTPFSAISLSEVVNTMLGRR